MNHKIHLKRRSRGWVRLYSTLLVLIIVCCTGGGWVAAQTAGSHTPALLAQISTGEDIGTVDRIPEAYQLGQQLYLENCATCHIGLPPQVLPTETWRRLLQDPEHYGQTIKLLVDPPRLLVWNYLQTFSRPQPKDEDLPYRAANSRYFKALHPRVKLPQPANLSSCVTCHPGASQYNFRKLTPEWENSP
ncbi:diheme cytochrome C [Tychonema sp. LEGE 07199]|uniref:diheme cytochrome C n=1 Tax=unclassified Tychonema TaxID=2642144 RepID=UPI00187EA6ED|nr:MULTISPECIES: diheme cytochrome C [unclassified Tychonema]MBE9122253.1 diheme cytochrome C [Tychonema sp. LEGE 07199]MBE9134415.1 diheme cytochrome C [Tychonema sp. LEGE 07196]